MLCCIFIPLFLYLVLFFGGRIITRVITFYLFVILFSLLFIFNYFLLIQSIYFNQNYSIFFFNWFYINELTVSLEFLFDALSINILAIVSFISLLVHLYSFYYIIFDNHFNRFISYLSLFTFFIFILVTASNFLQLFIGWEGVGLCSYLLINFWYTRIQANKSSIKAILINRIGDIGFIIAISLIFWLFKTLDFSLLSSLVPIMYQFNPYVTIINVNIIIIDLICGFLILGIIGKSAQIGLHTWLPAAIEGPTPVSALIHAATMVTAGIFLLLRSHYFFNYSLIIQNFIIIIGIVTAVISALTALIIYDIKRIIAYSTCSQLGYIVLACGFSYYNLGFFHLINHAFFKALLFLTAGMIIHNFNNEQDIRKLYNLYFFIPFLYVCILVGNIAIIGIPFLTGYYSKDLIIELTFLINNNLFFSIYLPNYFLFSLIIFATFCTGAYSWRLYYFLFLRNEIVNLLNKLTYSQQNIFIYSVLSFLVISSIFFGYLFNDLFQITHFFFNLLGSIINNVFFFNYNYFENDFLNYYIKLLPLYCNIIGFIVMYIVAQKNNYKLFLQILIFLVTISSPVKHSILLVGYLSFYQTFKQVITIIQYNFYFTELYNYISLINYFFYYKIFVNSDKGILELFGPFGLISGYYYLTIFINYFFYQNLKHFIFIIYISILVLFFIIDVLF